MVMMIAIFMSLDLPRQFKCLGVTCCNTSLQSGWHSGQKLEPKARWPEIPHQGHCVGQASSSKKRKYLHMEWLRCIWTPALSGAQARDWYLEQKCLCLLGSHTSAAPLNSCLHLLFETMELNSLASLISWWQECCLPMCCKTLQEMFTRKMRGNPLRSDGCTAQQRGKDIKSVKTLTWQRFLGAPLLLLLDTASCCVKKKKMQGEVSSVTGEKKRSSNFRCHNWEGEICDFIY